MIYSNFKNRKLAISVFVLVGFSVLFAAVIFLWGNAPQTWYGYVVGEDRRIYMVNLATGELEWKSGEFEQIGVPTGIEINRDESILYIASRRGRWQWEYFPLIAVKLNDQAELVFESYVDPEPQRSEGGILDVNAVYRMKLDTNANRLYIMYMDSEPFLRTILDPLTAEIVGRVDISILKNDEFSPDGSKVARIFPGVSGSEGDGNVTGRMIVLDTKSGEELSQVDLENNQGLNPPWENHQNNFIYVRQNFREDIFRLEVYDRESGELLVTHDLWDAFGLGSGQGHATLIPGSSDVAMSIGDSVVVFDPLTAEIKTRAYIGDFRFSQVVVTDKPLLVVK